MMTFQGQTSPYDLDMDIICYEKDGEWYLGGTVMTTGDTTTDDTTEQSREGQLLDTDIEYRN